MMKYNMGKAKYENWVITENQYKEEFLGKTESIFLLGNGYLGIRSANEETTLNTMRDTFISGIFNKADEKEVTELPNVNDIYELNLKIDGKNLIINNDTVVDYNKSLNLKTGELSREFKVINQDLEVKIKTLRFVSYTNLHLSAQTYEIEVNKDVDLEFFSWINGQKTNSGAQHFQEGDKKLIDGKYLQNITKTTESNIFVTTHVAHEFNVDVDEFILMDRRKIGMRYRYKLKQNQNFKMQKYGVFTTSIDKDCKENYTEFGLQTIKEVVKSGFEKELEKSICAWDEYWKTININIKGDDFSLLALRFAQYQLKINCPMHDERMNIGAKGLSGEGYKGHTFWDTELFMLPYFIFTQPKSARKLIKYRYLGLEGARKKAEYNGYDGAMYPWEAAWPSDGEVTPIWGAADIISGEPTKIWSGFIEQHITADVIYGLWLYYQVTGDQEFMNKYGYEMIFDTANYWASRVEKSSKGYVINNVIGPDEYKEHVDNNSFTNYMAKWNLDLALSYLKTIDQSVLKKIQGKIKIKEDIWEDVSKNIFLQVPNDKNVLPQDDTYLSLKEIDLTKYKNSEHVGSMFEDYSLSEVNKMQVSKQADVMILFLLMEGLFTKDVKKASWDYYEPKTLHDSSLSLSTHVVLAQDLKRKEISEELFLKACKIDIGDNMKTSDHGIHTASLGGIWQGVVYGFGGVRIVDQKLRIEPSLHSKWTELEYPITYLGNKLNIKVTRDTLEVTNLGKSSICFINQAKEIEVGSSKTIKINI